MIEDQALLNSFISQGPTVTVMGIAIVALWRHIQSKDKEHRQDIREMVAGFSQSLDKNTEVLNKNSEVMAKYNDITKKLSENLYANLVLKKKVKE